MSIQKCLVSALNESTMAESIVKDIYDREGLCISFDDEDGFLVSFDRDGNVYNSGRPGSIDEFVNWLTDEHEYRRISKGMAKKLIKTIHAEIIKPANFKLIDGMDEKSKEYFISNLENFRENSSDAFDVIITESASFQEAKDWFHETARKFGFEHRFRNVYKLTDTKSGNQISVDFNENSCDFEFQKQMPEDRAEHFKINISQIKSKEDVENAFRMLIDLDFKRIEENVQDNIKIGRRTKSKGEAIMERIEQKKQRLATRS